MSGPYQTRLAANISGGDSLSLLLQTTSKALHLVWQILLGGDGGISIYEDPAIASTGIALPVRSLDRTFQNASTVIATHAPVVEELVTALQTESVFDTDNRVPPITQQSQEWIYKPNSLYLLVLTNADNTTQPGVITAKWTECK